jgi:hypothetical protein
MKKNSILTSLNHSKSHFSSEKQNGKKNGICFLFHCENFPLTNQMKTASLHFINKNKKPHFFFPLKINQGMRKVEFFFSF